MTGPGPMHRIVSLAAVALLALIAVACGGTTGVGGTGIGAAEEATIRIEAPEGVAWSGAIGDRTEEGTGDGEFTIDLIGGIGSANVQKQGDDSETVAIVAEVGGEEVDRSETSAAFGVAQVTVGG